MVATLTDPRLALADRRAVLQGVLRLQRTALKAICGCDRCGGQGAREQLVDAIGKNVRSVSELSDLICDYPTLER
jgi:hypothetical protein